MLVQKGIDLKFVILVDTHPVCFLERADDSQKFVGDSVPIVWTIRGLTVVLNDSGIAEMVHCLFAECLATVVCVNYTIFFVDKINNIMDAYPFICRIFKFSFLFFFCYGEQCQTI